MLPSWDGAARRAGWASTAGRFVKVEPMNRGRRDALDHLRRRGQRHRARESALRPALDDHRLGARLRPDVDEHEERELVVIEEVRGPREAPGSEGDRHLAGDAGEGRRGIQLSEVRLTIDPWGRSESGASELPPMSFSASTAGWIASSLSAIVASSRSAHGMPSSEGSHTRRSRRPVGAASATRRVTRNAVGLATVSVPSTTSRPSPASTSGGSSANQRVPLPLMSTSTSRPR
jgi:hypothetical protein